MYPIILNENSNSEKFGNAVDAGERVDLRFAIFLFFFLFLLFAEFQERKKIIKRNKTNKIKFKN